MEHFESGKTQNLGIEKLRPDFRMQVELALRFYRVQKETLTKELASKKELLELRIQTLEKQENQLKEKVKKLQGDVLNG